MDGFLNLNKPSGLTSHDCVARVRRLLKLKRVGHGGTLDPAATGVLPIALGRATRLLQFLATGKAYRATIRFGVRTATDDLEGEVLSSQPAAWLKRNEVEEHLPQFQGTIQQIPPSYSAIQVDGQRLYDLARAGQAVEAPVRTVQVHHITELDWRGGDFPELDVAIDCGAGTYIRSIARDLGEVVGTGGTLAALLRTRSSSFVLEDSLTLEELAAQMEAGKWVPIPPVAVLQHLEPIVLSEEMAKRWSQGQRLPWAENQGDDRSPVLVRVQRQTSEFLGIGEFRLTEDGLILAPKLVW